MLEDLAAITRLSLFGDMNAMGIVLTGEDERTMQLLNSTLSSSKTSVKSIYTLWITHSDEGQGSQMGLAVEAMLSH